MKKTYKILVMLSAYRGQKFLPEQLASLRKQKNVELYYLLRDDGSDSRTLELLRQFSRDNAGVEVIAGSNLGFANSFLSLLHEAGKYLGKVDYFMFSDQDDFWYETKAIRAVSQLKDRTGPWLYHSNVDLAAADLSLIAPLNPANAQNIEKWQALTCGYCLGCTFCFNSQLLELLLKHAPSGVHSHDRWVYLFAHFFGNVLYDPEPTMKYRQHGNNLYGASPQKQSYLHKLLHISPLRQAHKYQTILFENATSLHDFGPNTLSVEDRRTLAAIARAKMSFYGKLRLSWNWNRWGLRFPTRTSNFLHRIMILV